MVLWKRLLTACSLLLPYLAGHGQIVWEKTWGGPYDDGCEVRNTADGGMIVMGSFSTLDSWMLRLDQNGDTLWSTRITQPFDLGAVTETYDGGFLAVGVTRTPHRDLIAWKFNLRGDSIWRKTYADTLYSEGIYSVLQQRDSSFLITGYTSEHGYDMLAIHVDSVGNELWRRAYGGPGFEGGTMASPTSDGGYVFATTAGNSPTSRIWVVRVDALGDTVWTRNVIEPHQIGGAIPTVLSNGNILVMGWMEQANDYDNYLVCLDAQGNFRWSQRYPGIGFESRTARGVIADRFGGYTFASSVDLAYGPSGTDFDIALFRLDTLGFVTQIHRIGHAGDEMPRYFEQAGNGDYLFLGYSTSFIPQGQQMYLARLHPGGCGEFFYDLAGANHLTVCPGDTVWADAGAGFAHYLWSDGDTTQLRMVTQSDTLYVQAVDAQGCVHYSSGIVATVRTGPQFVWTSMGNLGVQFDGQLGDGILPQWDFGDGDSAFVEDTTYTYAQSGTYYVCLQAFVPSCGLESSCDSVTVVGQVGLPRSTNAEPSIYPNPNTGRFALSNPSPSLVAYRMADLHGKLILQGQVAAFSEAVLGGDALANGVYLLQISGDVLQTRTLRLVITR